MVQHGLSANNPRVVICSRGGSDERLVRVARPAGIVDLVSPLEVLDAADPFAGNPGVPSARCGDVLVANSSRAAWPGQRIGMPTRGIATLISDPTVHSWTTGSPGA